MYSTTLENKTSPIWKLYWHGFMFMTLISPHTKALKECYFRVRIWIRDNFRKWGLLYLIFAIKGTLLFKTYGECYIVARIHRETYDVLTPNKSVWGDIDTQKYGIGCLKSCSFLHFLGGEGFLPINIDNRPVLDIVRHAYSCLNLKFI